MAIVEMRAGAKWDLLDQGQLTSALSNHTASWFREMARGLKHMQIPAQIGTIADTAVSIPSPGGEAVGPQPGFVWAIQRLSAQGLGTGDVLGVYRNSVDPMNYVCELTDTLPYLILNKSFLLKDGDRLVFANIGALAGTGNVVVTGEFIECSQIDIWKLIGR